MFLEESQFRKEYQCEFRSTDKDLFEEYQYACHMVEFTRDDEKQMWKRRKWGLHHVLFPEEYTQEYINEERRMWAQEQIRKEEERRWRYR